MQDNIKAFMEILRKDLQKELNKVFEKHIEDLKNMHIHYSKGETGEYE